LVLVLALAGGPFLAAGQDLSPEAAVKGRIEAKFKQAGLLVGNDIQVAVEGKTITLSGTARTLAVKEQAGRDAQSVAKGYKLVNNIALAESGQTPAEVADSIMAAIEKSLSYFIFDYVEVGVTGQGVAILKGWTSYPSSAKDFVKLAQAQPGVQKVDNQINRLIPVDSDQALRLYIARLIYTHPTGPSFPRTNGPVHILVFNNVVTLAGTVDKEADITGFEQLVRSNTGGVSVINALRLRKR
jgi:osmotically-inducible protein OsmY